MRKKNNLLMIVENTFPYDPRVRKEAGALKRHFKITVISLKRYKSEKLFEVIEGIRIFRIPEFPASPFMKLSYILEYAYFTGIATILFLITHLFFRYKVVHVHNPPDTLFIIGLMCKILSVKFVFDHHDLSPELYLAKFSNKKDLLYNMLTYFEKMSCRMANLIVCTNQSYKDIEMSRHNIKGNKIVIVRNDPIIDECTINDGIDEIQKSSDKKVLLFLGSINPQDGLENLLHALNYIVYNLNRKDFTCNIVGNGDSLVTLKVLAVDLGLNDYVNFKGIVREREKVMGYLASSDIGIEPAPENELNMHSTFIKVMEYMAAAIPIVAFDLKETRFSAEGSSILIPPGDIRAFAEAIVELIDDAKLRQKLGATGFARVTSQFTWDKSAAILLSAYKSMNTM